MDIRLPALALLLLLVPLPLLSAEQAPLPAPGAPNAAGAPTTVAETHEPSGGPSPWALEASVRWVTLPDGLVSGLFSTHTSMQGWAVSAGARRRTSGGEWRFGLDWTQLDFASGNWLEKNLPPASAVFLDWDLGFLSASAAYTWRFPLLGEGGERLVLLAGAGAMVGVFIGDVYATDVVPTCAGDVERCQHWQHATRRALDLPTRVIGAPILTLGAESRVHGPWLLRVEGGLWGVPYVGAAVAWEL